MSKATKLTFAAALLVGSCGLAMAQGSADKTEGSEAGRGRPALHPPPATSGAQSSGQHSSGNAMQEKNTNLNAGQETGTVTTAANEASVTYDIDFLALTD